MSDHVQRPVEIVGRRDAAGRIAFPDSGLSPLDLPRALAGALCVLVFRPVAYRQNHGQVVHINLAAHLPRLLLANY